MCFEKGFRKKRQDLQYTNNSSASGPPKMKNRQYKTSFNSKHEQYLPSCGLVYFTHSPCSITYCPGMCLCVVCQKPSAGPLEWTDYRGGEGEGRLETFITDGYSDK